jgi:Outer membrane protein beta-barrel domain
MKLSHLYSVARILCVFILCISVLKAQSPFKAGVIVGANFAQIDGDHQSGYHKFGTTFGLRGGFAVRKNLDIMTELLYIEKGTVPDNNTSVGFDGRRATIVYKYAEVPLLLSHYIKKNELGQYQWNIYAGVSYSRLLRSSSTVNVKNIYNDFITKSIGQENLNKQDFALIFGLNYMIIPNLGLGIRHSTSLNYVYTNLNPERASNGRILRDAYLKFRNYFVSIQLQYDFVAPKVKTKKAKNATPTRRATRG